MRALDFAQKTVAQRVFKLRHDVLQHGTLTRPRLGIGKRVVSFFFSGRLFFNRNLWLRLGRSDLLRRFDAEPQHCQFWSTGQERL